MTVFGGYENETEDDREESRSSAGKKKQVPQSVSLLGSGFSRMWFKLTSPGWR
jgi:hypothetical protein